jgi:hypothetical protein
MTTTVIFASIILVVGQVAIGVFLLEIVMRVMRGLDERAVAARRRGGECFEQFLQERSALIASVKNNVRLLKALLGYR